MQQVPFLYGLFVRARGPTETEREPRDLGSYLVFDLERAAEASLGLWTRQETKDHLADMDAPADRFASWVERQGRIGITALDAALMTDPNTRRPARSRNLTRMAAYLPEDPRYRGSISPKDQLNMGIKGRRRGHRFDEPTVRSGSFHNPFLVSGAVHPHARIGHCCPDSGEHKGKVRDYETEVICYHTMARLIRASNESLGRLPLTIKGLERGDPVFMPIDLWDYPELVLDAFVRRYVDHQPLWEISFSMSDFYENILSPAASRMLMRGDAFFGMMPLIDDFSENCYKIKEAVIRELWRRERQVPYDFVGHSIEPERPETVEIFGQGFRPSYVFQKRESRPLVSRKRAHVVINPETETAYYVFKVPMNRQEEVRTGKPVATYTEIDKFYRKEVFCAVFAPKVQIR